MAYDKILGVDYGNARIGIALSDSLKIIAVAKEVYHRKSLEIDLEYISAIIKRENVEVVVFGLPLQMDGEEGEIAGQAREFASQVAQNANIRIEFVDERLTSYEAEEYLKEAKIHWKDRKKILDKVAAQIILQNYLDKINRGY